MISPTFDELKFTACNELFLGLLKIMAWPAGVPSSQKQTGENSINYASKLASVILIFENLVNYFVNFLDEIGSFNNQVQY